MTYERDTAIDFEYDDMNGNGGDLDKAEKASGIGSSNSINGSLVIGFDPNNVFFYEKTCKFPGGLWTKVVRYGRVAA